MLRAEQEGIVRMKIEVDNEEAMAVIDEIIIKNKTKLRPIYI